MNKESQVKLDIESSLEKKRTRSTENGRTIEMMKPMMTAMKGRPAEPSTKRQARK